MKEHTSSLQDIELGTEQTVWSTEQRAEGGTEQADVTEGAGSSRRGQAEAGEPSEGRAGADEDAAQAEGDDTDAAQVEDDMVGVAEPGASPVSSHTEAPSQPPQSSKSKRSRPDPMAAAVASTVRGIRGQESATHVQDAKVQTHVGSDGQQHHRLIEEVFLRAESITEREMKVSIGGIALSHISLM